MRRNYVRVGGLLKLHPHTLIIQTALQQRDSERGITVRPPPLRPSPYFAMLEGSGFLAMLNSADLLDINGYGLIDVDGYQLTAGGSHYLARKMEEIENG